MASVRVCTLVLTSSSHSARSIALLNTELKVWNTNKKEDSDKEQIRNMDINTGSKALQRIDS